MAKAQAKASTRKKKATRSRGRPSSYKPEFCHLAEQHCLLGATNDDLARLFEVAPSTIDLWIKKKPEFSGAVKKGRADADAKVARSLFERACGYSHPDVHISNYQGEVTVTEVTKHYPPDTAAAFIWLKNRRPDLWRDKQEHQLSGPNGEPVQVHLYMPDNGRDGHPT